MKNQYEIDYLQGYDNANEEWLDHMDKIRVEIEKQEKWLLQAGYTEYNVHIAFDAIRRETYREVY